MLGPHSERGRQDEWHTRGPHSAPPSSSPLTRENGPLVQGPLDPLVQGGRVAIDERVVTLLRTEWPPNEHGRFPCPVPGHRGEAFLLEQDGQLRLGCCTGRWRSLGEVWALIAYGEDRFLTNIEIAAWTRRLAHKAGSFEAVEVTVPPLRPDAPANARRVREGFVLLLSLRWADGPRRACAYSVRFTAAWCQISHGGAAQGLRVLRAEKVIEQAGRVGLIPLYLPGAGT